MAGQLSSGFFVMTASNNRALLPDGLGDALPPDAAHEAAVIDRLVAVSAAWGYERVDPPLIEFEEHLLEGTGEDLSLATFRLMDPVSQRMMGVRADMTPQVARIAGSRLAKAPRPLRLSYAGHVLRVRGDQLRPERQFFEAGVELIGADGTEADAEVIALAFESLTDAGVGVEILSVDLALPRLRNMLCDFFNIVGKARKNVFAALDSKDFTAIGNLDGEAAKLFGDVLAVAGPAGEALARLKRVELPEEARQECDALGAVVDRLAEASPGLAVTVDPLEHRGFGYYAGLSFTFFGRGIRGSLGRGGRYRTPDANEPAIGFTLFLDTIMRAVPDPDAVRRIYLPPGKYDQEAQALRAEGWVTVRGLSQAPVAAEMERLACSHVLTEKGSVALKDVAQKKDVGS